MLSIAQIKEFIKVAQNIEFHGASRKEKYAWIEEILLRFGYFRIRKKEKTILKDYIGSMAGFSDAQTTRLIAKKKQTGRIIADSTQRHRFPKKYGCEDVAMLIETDNAHDRLSGPATKKKIFEREFTIFNKESYRRLKDISVAHIYNLRHARNYQSFARFFTKTRPTSINIGERRRPDTQGEPGYLRVDTVHQGDLDKEKGVYHINLVDEITQWEIVVAVEKISEYYLRPAMETALAQFPFKIKGFHSDNGSEFINKVVARLLSRLLIQQTKSRARRCNDNALVESKNGSIIRKQMGYMHIPQHQAGVLDRFYQEYLNPYLNYHRPCGFASRKIDSKGKIKKVYDVYLTPYEALKSNLNASNFLKAEVTLEKLDKIAHEKSDNEFAAQMQKAKVELFKNLTSQKLQFPTTYQHHFGFIS